MRLRPALAVAAMIALAGCSDTYEWHQRLTVEVETPEGVKSGSSVVEIRKTHNVSEWTLPEARGVKTGVSGEAAVVEVAPGRYLFALLKGAGQLARYTFPTDIPPQNFKEWALAMEQMRGVGDVPRDRTPLLVTFTDIDDSKTVKRVDPGNLAASFGPDVSLRSITLEITDAPVTDGEVESVLPWLARFGEGMLDGRRYQTIEAENRLANSLGVGSFSTELYR